VDGKAVVAGGAQHGASIHVGRRIVEIAFQQLFQRPLVAAAVQGIEYEQSTVRQQTVRLAKKAPVIEDNSKHPVATTQSKLLATNGNASASARTNGTPAQRRRKPATTAAS
jgi:hypothetical protein